MSDQNSSLALSHSSLAPPVTRRSLFAERSFIRACAGVIMFIRLEYSTVTPPAPNFREVGLSYTHIVGYLHDGFASAQHHRDSRAVCHRCTWYIKCPGEALSRCQIAPVPTGRVHMICRLRRSGRPGSLVGLLSHLVQHNLH